MTFFAESLKKLRQEANLSMQTLADKACVSKSMISKIERDEVQPTLDIAARLAKALDKNLSEMLHSAQPRALVFLPKDQQAVWEDANTTKRRNISPIFDRLKMEWLHVELPAHKQIDKCMAIGTSGVEKCILVIKGTLHLQVNEQDFYLHVGDSLYLDATYPHIFFNDTDESVEYYIVINYP